MTTASKKKIAPPPPRHGDVFRAELARRLSDTCDEQTTRTAIDALSRIATPIEPSAREITVRMGELRSRIAHEMERAGCDAADARAAASIVADAVEAYCADGRTRHPRATKEEIIGALRAELHPNHAV